MHEGIDCGHGLPEEQECSFYGASHSRQNLGPT